MKIIRSITSNAQNRIPPLLQLFLWNLFDEMDVKSKDYLQVFRLSVSDDGTQHIIHEQEEPEYRKEYDIQVDTPINAKVYVIDDNDHSTMLLAEEY